MTTPNMGLTLPTPTVTPGPDYATQNNAAFTAIDSHTHVAGQGVQVPVAGLNINADLPLGGFNLTGTRSLRMTPTAAALALTTDRGCCYVLNNDLHFIDAAGNDIQITLSGAVNTASAGNISGMGATTAAVTYSSGSSTFSFTSNTNVPAYLSTGPITVGLNSSGTKTITLTPNATQVSNYTLQLPAAIPGSGTQLLTLDSTGAMATYGVDNTTIGVSSSNLYVPSSGINTTQLASSAVTTAKIASQAVTTATIADGNVTNVKRAALGQQTSSGSPSTTSVGTLVTSAISVTLTSTGRPVYVAIEPSGSTAATITFNMTNSLYGCTGTVAIYQDGTNVNAWLVNGSVINTPTAGATANGLLPPGTVLFPASGSHTYTVWLCNNSNSNSITLNSIKLVAFEL